LYEEHIAQHQEKINIATERIQQQTERTQGLQRVLEDAHSCREATNTELNVARADVQRALDRVNIVEHSWDTAKKRHAARVAAFRDEVLALQGRLEESTQRKSEIAARDATRIQAAEQNIEDLTNNLKQARALRATSDEEHLLQLEQQETQFKEKIELLESHFTTNNSALEARV
jgi:hypothetical protein